jgi:hypothetical protein
MDKYIYNLIIAILSQPALLISCIQCIIGFFALIFVCIEFPKIRKDLAFRKIESILFIRDWITSEYLHKRHEVIIEAYKAKTENNEYPDYIHMEIVETMSDLEQICELIRMHYMTEKIYYVPFLEYCFHCLAR